MRIRLLVASVAVFSMAASTASLMAHDSRPAEKPASSAQDSKPPASPRSSHDSTGRKPDPTRYHQRLIQTEDDKTLLWANGDYNGGDKTIWFDMTDALIDPAKFQFGIGKDSIPSIDNPEFAPYGDSKLTEAKIGDQTDIIGYVANGVAKAYPLFILDRHEVVNDVFKDQPFAVYW